MENGSTTKGRYSGKICYNYVKRAGGVAMEVRHYIYQSPYNSPVQFGRPDTSEGQKQETELLEKSDATLQKAQQIHTSMQKESEIQINTQNKLDLYA